MLSPYAPTGNITPSIRVLLADDHGIVRAGVQMLLESQPGITVVGDAATYAETLALATHTQPDVIVLELALGGEQACEHIPALLCVTPAARIVILTGVRDPAAHRQAVRHGAVGLVLKEQAADTLLQAIVTVCAGGVWLDPLMVAQMPVELLQPPPPVPEVTQVARLTAREREVITLIGAGLRNQHIAARLAISEATVRHHLTAIFTKVGVADRLALALYAYQHGLAQPPARLIE